MSNEDVIKMANIFCEDATAAEVYIKIADGLHEGERLWVQRQLESTGAWGRAIRNLMYRKVTSINTTWNQSIAITSECVCDMSAREPSEVPQSDRDCSSEGLPDRSNSSLAA